MSTVYFRNTFERAMGTFPLKGAACRAAVETALEIGYRAFDTAQMYANEEEVGDALAGSGLPRESLLVTTKVHPDHYTPEDFLPSVERSLKALKLDAIDVLLLHWPPTGGDVAPSLRLLSEARAKGLTRHVGVSNYTVAMLRKAKGIIEDPIVTNQVEFHPLLNQDALLKGSAELGVPLASYCSIARGAIFERPDFAEIGETYGKTAAQVCLRWILQKGVSINAMSTKAENLQANFAVMDFTLSHVDMARIDALTHENRRIVTSNVVPWTPDWD